MIISTILKKTKKVDMSKVTNMLKFEILVCRLNFLDFSQNLYMKYMQ